MTKDQCANEIVQFYNNYKLDILEHLFSKLEKKSHKIEDEYEGEWAEDPEGDSWYVTYKFKNNRQMAF